MQLRSFMLVPDHVVLQDLRTSVSHSNLATARLIELLAVVDERRLYASEGYDSVLAFCIGDLNLSEDAARKRIQAARAAQACPAILTAIAQGQLHLSAVVLLAPHLTPQNAATLIAEATHRTKEEIGVLLARHFPRPDVTALIEVVPCAGPLPLDSQERVLEPVQDLVKPSIPARVEPRSEGRYAVQFMLDESQLAELRHAQELAARLVNSSDLVAFYTWAVREVIRMEEKRQYSTTPRPRASKGGSDNSRIPAQVKRAVRERDQRRCAFVSDSGKRCAARRFLEFDHIKPVADGGKSTLENVRLLCSAHNQLEAERRFGKGFMDRKRQEARAASSPMRGEVQKSGPIVDPDFTTHDPDHMDIRAQREEIIPFLRTLGFRVHEARRGAAMCDHMHDASLDARVKFALAGLGRARFERSTHRPSSTG